MNVMDKKMFYFNDQRVMYSVNDLKCLIEDRVETTADSIVRIGGGLSFRAGDVVKNSTSLFHNLLSLTVNEPTNQ